MTNQDKREMLEIFSECLQGTKNAMGKFDVSLLHSKIHTKILSLREDKPEREMLLDDKKYLYIDVGLKNAFVISEDSWFGTSVDELRWKNGRAFLLSERALAEKKCAELNEILRR